MESYRQVCVAGMISVLMLAQTIHCDTGQQYSNFHKFISCNLKLRVRKGWAHLKRGENQSLVRCAAICQDGCCGVSLDDHQVCYHHHANCTEEIQCSRKDLFFKLYIKNPCEHNGLWDEVRSTCKCTGGWVGDRCERYPRNCKEMTLYGYEDKFHERLVLHPETSPQPFTARCSYYRDRKEYFTYIMSNTGVFDNTMTWSDYVNGFEHNNMNYWLGLQNMKLLNDAGHTEIFFLVSISGTGNLHYYSFTQFRMGSAETGYNFTAVVSEIDSEGGVYGDCLTAVQGVPFSTTDHDRDLETTRNCAREGKSGWWFKTCDVGCNPLGPASHWRMLNSNLDRNVQHTYMYFRDV